MIGQENLKDLNWRSCVGALWAESIPIFQVLRSVWITSLGSHAPIRQCYDVTWRQYSREGARQSGELVLCCFTRSRNSTGNSSILPCLESWLQHLSYWRMYLYNVSVLSTIPCLTNNTSIAEHPCSGHISSLFELSRSLAKTPARIITESSISNDRTPWCIANQGR